MLCKLSVCFWVDSIFWLCEIVKFGNLCVFIGCFVVVMYGYKIDIFDCWDLIFYRFCVIY